MAPVEPWFVLPDSLRRREIKADPGMLLGRYTATLYLNKGYADQVVQRQISFWAVPLIWILPLLVLIAVGVYMLRLSRKK